MNDAAPETVRIEPGRLRRWFWPVVLPLLVGCLVFGAFTLWQRGRFELHDCFLVSFFQVGALMLSVHSVLATWAAWRMPRVTMILSPAGLTLCVPPGPGTIPWPDIDAVGLVRDSWVGQTAGLRLRSYDGFHASLGAEGLAKLRLPLAELREFRGYEVDVPRQVLDCSAEEFLGLLEEYLERYGNPPLAA